MTPIDFLLSLDTPRLCSQWGLFVVAVFSFAGVETMAVVAGFLCAVGILALPEAFAAAALPAFAADFLLFAAARRHPGARWIESFTRQPLLGRPLPLFVARLPQAVFYRLLPQNKQRFPLLAGQGGSLAPKEFAALSLASSLAWAAAMLAFGYAIAVGALALSGGRPAVWHRLPGFILLVFLLYPVLRFILWYEMDKLKSRGRGL